MNKHQNPRSPINNRHPRRTMPLTGIVTEDIDQ